jgi:DNA repair exonuclease SbcCD ATPase subunit
MVGKNGAGKSTILDALTFGLFSKPFRNIRKPQLVNSVTRKNMLVEIEFTLNRKNYLIRRGMKPAVFEVYQDDKLLNQSAEMKDYQEVLEKQILKVNYKSFCQVIILGSATFVPFMNLTTGARREIVEDLLDLQIFTTMNILIKEKLNRNLEDLRNLETEKTLTEEKIILITDHIEQLQTSNEDFVNEKKAAIDETTQKLKLAEDELEELRANRAMIDETLKGRSAYTKKLNDFNNWKNKISIKCDHIRNETNFFKENSVCPTCTQSIDEVFRTGILGKHAARIEEYEKALEDLRSKKEAVEKEIMITLQYESDRTDNGFKIIQIESDISNYKKRISDIEDEINNLSVRAQAIDTGRIQELEEQLSGISDRYNKLHEDRKIMTAAATMLKDDGIKSKIVKQYVPIINKLINKNLAALDFMCHFELDENFDETILSRGRDDFSYSSFSEGEKFRINIAILFAWRSLARLRNSISTNILILDEILDGSLDQEGTDEFMKVLQNLTENNNVFIISHRQDQLIDKFPNTLQFEKVHGFSTLMEVE